MGWPMGLNTGCISFLSTAFTYPSAGVAAPFISLLRIWLLSDGSRNNNPPVRQDCFRLHQAARLPILWSSMAGMHKLSG